MTNIKFEINNFPSFEDLNDFDINCIENIEKPNNIISYSIITVTCTDIKIKIRFEWKENVTELTINDFLYIPETNILFFNSLNQWGAIDLKTKTLKRHENSQWLPFIVRKGNYILIEDDLCAESTTLSADKIDSVPIDPPTESKIYEDRIEYNSPVYGKQILKTK